MKEIATERTRRYYFVVMELAYFRRLPLRLRHSRVEGLLL